MKIAEAFQIAKNDLIEAFGKDIHDIRLEEFTTISEDSNVEFVISFLIKKKYPDEYPTKKNTLSGLAAIAQFSMEYERVYKRVGIDTIDKKVIWVKIVNE